jgi:GntR family transcriptional regulator
MSGSSSSQARVIRYRLIAEDLRSRIDAGEFRAGSLLPSEAELSTRYDASRVTVRRALESIRETGVIDSRQGFGWYVAADPFRQRLTHLGTIEDQLRESGIESERRILAFGFIAPPSRVAAVFGPAPVLEVRRLNLADGQPFALVTVWCPEPLASRLSRSDVERATFLEQLPVELGGATQTIGAAIAALDEAELLGIGPGSPVLVAERVTRSSGGQPVLMSRHVYPALRTEFAVELAVDSRPAVGADQAIEPHGLRLVE